MDALRRVNPKTSRLTLLWGTRRVHLDEQSCVGLGRAEDSDLTPSGGYVSQYHATIQFEPKRGEFCLTDHSANGTYVQAEDRQVVLCHRKVLSLWGTGFLSLGEPLCPENAIRFAHV